MPELPDLTVYVEALRERTVGQHLTKVRLAHPFLLRTATPALVEAHGKAVTSVSRLGKRIVLGVAGDLFLLLHLMIAGRLHWREPDARVPAKTGLAAFDFPAGSLLLTEAGSKRRASLHVVRGAESVKAFDSGGIEPLTCDRQAFGEALARERHTIKRTLTDPHLFSGIGNAYSDEILHHARLSPVKLTSQLTEPEVSALFDATRGVLTKWIDRLRTDAGERFPEKVTAFREGMAVHGRYGRPCPVCGSRVQRIVHAENETNYCARCQTGGKLLADRALSRLLRSDWPRTLEEMERLRHPPPHDARET